MNTVQDIPEFGRRDSDWEDDLILVPVQPDMQHIAAQLASVAASLAEIMSSHDTADSPAQTSLPDSQQQQQRSYPLDLGQQAVLAYELRRKRDAIFGQNELFGEPAWDILLDLYSAQAKGLAVSVSSACIASAGPATTALRWLRNLQDAGLIERSNDPQDQRRVLVRLTRKGIQKMENYLSGAAAQRGA